jgi:hypothetical protein
MKEKMLIGLGAGIAIGASVCIGGELYGFRGNVLAGALAIGFFSFALGVAEQICAEIRKLKV